MIVVQVKRVVYWYELGVSGDSGTGRPAIVEVTHILTLT